MARQTTMHCDFCGAEIEKAAAKVYLAPVLPGKASTSFMSAYSHYGDICTSCMTERFIPKMQRRQARPSNNNTTKRQPKKKSRA